MRKVFKYAVPMLDEFSIDMPAGAQLLTFQEQHGEGQLWALVDPAKPIVAHHFRLAGTGHPIVDERALHFVGTAQFHGSALVLHLFEFGDVSSTSTGCGQRESDEQTNDRRRILANE